MGFGEYHSPHNRSITKETWATRKLSRRHLTKPKTPKAEATKCFRFWLTNNAVVTKLLLLPPPPFDSIKKEKGKDCVKIKPSSPFRGRKKQTTIKYKKINKSRTPWEWKNFQLKTRDPRVELCHERALKTSIIVIGLWIVSVQKRGLL